MKQGVNERTPKASTHYHSHLETTGHWRIDTVVAQGWATFSVPNTGPGLLMPFCIAALNQAFKPQKPSTPLSSSLRHLDHVLTCLEMLSRAPRSESGSEATPGGSSSTAQHRPVHPEGTMLPFPSLVS